MNKIPIIQAKNYNFGDNLNIPVLSTISDSEFINYQLCSPELRKLSAIGSISHLWSNHTDVWGSGVLSRRLYCADDLEDITFYAVRGPETRKFLLNLGYKDIPEIYGDPGILAPYCYRGILSKNKKYKLGIFPHNSENSNWIFTRSVYLNRSDFRIIPFGNPLDDNIRLMSSCEFICSSSLHGIIIAEMLGIPCAWYRATDINDPFKFYDYFEGTGRSKDDIVINDIRGKDSLEVKFEDMKFLPAGEFNIEGLLKSFPYKLKDGIIDKILTFYDEKRIVFKNLS